VPGGLEWPIAFEMPGDLQLELDRFTAKKSSAIVDVAVRSFRRKGYLATTTRAIASDAGLSNATLYHHVADKEELLFLICLQAFNEQGARQVDGLVGSTDPAEQLQRFVMCHVAVLLEDSDRASVALTESRHLSGLRDEQIADLDERYESVLRRIIESGQMSRQIRRNAASPVLTRLILGTLNWTVLWYSRDGDWDPAHIGRVLYETVSRGAAAPD
jgi:AcrR family transcriptional regulator